MTTLNTSAGLDFIEAGTLEPKESLWSRILLRLGIMFADTCGYLNEDMGPIDDIDSYFWDESCCLW